MDRIKNLLRVVIKGIGAGLVLLAAAVLAAMILYAIAEYKPVSYEEVKITAGKDAKGISDGERISILTFDIGFAGLDAGRDYFMDGGKQNTPASKERVESNLEGILGVIKEQECDAILLQSVDRKAKRSYSVNEAAYFQRKLGMNSAFAQNYRHLFVPYPVTDCVGMVNSGIQTMTGFAIRSAERIALPSDTGWIRSMFAMKQCLLVTRIPVEGSGRELVLINLHMESRDDGKVRAAQTEQLIELIQAEYEMGNYVIVGGDFSQAFPNDNFKTYPLWDRENRYFQPGRLRKEMLSADWTFASDLSAPTCRLMDSTYDDKRWWAQYYVVDGFILSPNVTLESVETIDAEFAFSNHNPVRLVAVLGKEEDTTVE